MILLNPGPVNCSERVKKALLRPEICHREEEFSLLLRGIQEKILRAFAPDGDYTTVLLTGSGTSALEAGVSSSLPEGEKILVINNGVYGERISRIASIYRLNRVELKSPWEEPPSIERVEALLKKEKRIRVIAMVHHETTTGLINPVKEIGALAHTYGKIFLVDSISGLGGEEIDLAEENVDICIGTANKCIQGFPGVSFVIVRRSLMEHMMRIPPRTLSLNIPEHYREQKKGGISFTPSIQICYALDEALTELLEEEVTKRIERYRRASRLLREGFKRAGLRFFLREELYSNTITSLHLPGGMTYNILHDRLKERGYVIYAGQGDLSGRIFRVANMGHLTTGDFERFLVDLTDVIQSR